MRTRVLDELKQFNVCGFNSGKYDLNLIKTELVPKLVGEMKTIKKNNNYVCISTPSLKFLDISNFVAAGVSLDKYLKAYLNVVHKIPFSYEYIDRLDKLKRRSVN